MDADSWNPAMKRYVELLIDRAPGRPVLQFNRIDFRLAWFRRQFPRAKLIHLYRHPRDQWCSCLAEPKSVPRELTVAEFTPYDGYYLRAWAQDLHCYFRCLDGFLAWHPYRLFYCLWKLSYLYGRRDAHHSLAYEDLLAQPETVLGELFQVLNLHDVPWPQLLAQIGQPRPSRRHEYAPDDWYAEHELAAERLLQEYFCG
jgi:hypothetical protein